MKKFVTLTLALMLVICVLVPAIAATHVCIVLPTKAASLTERGRSDQSIRSWR